MMRTTRTARSYRCRLSFRLLSMIGRAGRGIRDCTACLPEVSWISGTVKPDRQLERRMESEGAEEGGGNRA